VTGKRAYVDHHSGRGTPEAPHSLVEERASSPAQL
jgi:hypothetical protein